MHYRIQHQTTYRFNCAVFLEPHTLRVVPSSIPGQTVHQHRLLIEPEPMQLSCQQDHENNAVHIAWFAGTTDTLSITSESVVETTRVNTFDFIPDDAQCVLPVRYAPLERSALARFLVRQHGATPGVDEFAQSIAGTISHRLLPFLSALNDTLYRNIKCVVRDEGDPLPPAETLNLNGAACRDLAVLFIDACRSQGIAARFASGFQEGDINQDDRYLHAWAEVYIPGGGWRGYDPSHGLAVADRHIPVAAAAAPADAAPVVGTFRGTGAIASLSTQLVLERIESAPVPADC